MGMFKDLFGLTVELPVRIDPDDRSKIAIDWGNAPQGPPLGQVRPV